MCKSPPVDRFPGSSDAGEVARLREAAVRLAGELEGARHYLAAAYVAMAVDRILRDTTLKGSVVPQDERERSGTTDIELDFELDEHGRVWMIREGDCHVIGRQAAVCATMRRFLEVAG